MIIVTGGAGFIGSNIVKKLNERGIDDILVVDDLTDGRKCRNLQSLQFADYMDYEDFADLMADGSFDCGPVEVIFHEGACSDTMNYDGRYMMKNNYEGSKDILHYCLERRIPLLYASSASTYGSGKNGFREVSDCEEALNPYAFSKLQLIAMCDASCLMRKVRWQASATSMYSAPRKIIRIAWLLLFSRSIMN